jgi:hypothetical protein
VYPSPRIVGDEIKKKKSGRACDIPAEQRNAYRILVEKPE